MTISEFSHTKTEIIRRQNMKIYLVGGAVRDRLLGIPQKDRDYCVTGATPEEMTAKGFICVGRDFPVFLHPKTSEEYALARTERKEGHGYTGFICSFSPDVTIEEDLLRRDLTINAIAEDEEGRLIDPYNGQKDLENRVLRHVSDAFSEDPLRVLRLARFYSCFHHLGFSVAPETKELCRSLSRSGELKYLTAERVWQEVHKALSGRTPSVFFEFLDETGGLEILFPELYALKRVMENPEYHPEKDAFSHTMLTLKSISGLTANPVTRFAMLTHDLGKMIEYASDNPQEQKHRIVGVPLVEKMCQRLKVPKNYQKLAVNICRYHSYMAICRKNPEYLNRLFIDTGAYKDSVQAGIVGQCLRADFHGRSGFEKEPFTADYFLNFILARASRVKTAEVMADGFQGADITKELNRRRMVLIAEAQTQLSEMYPDTIC